MLKLIFIISLLGINISNVFGITLQTPNPHGQEDINVSGFTQIESDETTVFDIIQIINDYLWFAIAGVAMVVLVYGGIKLMTAGGNKDAMSTANKMIIGAIIAIFVAILSYAIIKLVVNLF
ncbi:MAG: hypothetical protein M0P94_00650 [Candidatus Absconditabacterales bacterium]|nr:hypothetical protein [Candidatus Absconditabacterales bacterium]